MHSIHSLLWLVFGFYWGKGVKYGFGVAFLLGYYGFIGLVLVLSITEQNINFVKEITDLQEIEDLKQEFKNSQVAESVFLNDDILKVQQIKEKLTKKLLEFRNGKREK